MGNYYNLAYSNDDVNAGPLWATDSNIIIKWNSKTNTGTATIIRFGYPVLKEGVDEYAEWMRFVKGDYSSENIISLPTLNFEVTKPITKEDYNKIISGGSKKTGNNVLSYIRSLPDTLPSNPNNNHEQSNGTHITNNEGSSSSNSYQGYNEFSSNVGVSKNLLSNNKEIESGEDGSKDGKSYEVSKKTNKQVDSNNIIYAVILIAIIGIIAGYRFIRNKKEN